MGGAPATSSGPGGPADAAAPPSPTRLPGAPPGPGAISSSDAFVAAAREYSSSHTVSVPEPRSRTWFPPAAGAGPVPSGTVRNGADDRSIGFSDRSTNEPAGTARDAARRPTAAAFWRGERATSNAGVPTSRGSNRGCDGGEEAWPGAAPGSSGPAEIAPDRLKRGEPPAPTISASSGAAVVALTCSSKYIATVPASRSRVGGGSAASRGGVASPCTVSATLSTALMRLREASENDPSVRDRRDTAAAAAAALSGGARSTTTVLLRLLPAPAAAGDTVESASGTSRPPTLGDSAIPDARAVEASTGSSNASASVPLPRYRRGGDDRSSLGGVRSRSTRIAMGPSSSEPTYDASWNAPARALRCVTPRTAAAWASAAESETTSDRPAPGPGSAADTPDSASTARRPPGGDRTPPPAASVMLPGDVGGASTYSSNSTASVRASMPSTGLRDESSSPSTRGGTISGTTTSGRPSAPA